jgi:hypothetical protein
VVRAAHRSVFLVSLAAVFLLVPARFALGQTPTPSPTVRLGPCTGPHCPRSGGFWIVFVVLAGLLVTYRLWLLRRR